LIPNGRGGLQRHIYHVVSLPPVCTAVTPVKHIIAQPNTDPPPTQCCHNGMKKYFPDINMTK